MDILCDRELAQVVSNHLRLDFDLVEFLARVDADNAANHLWDNDHVTQMRLDEVGLLVWLGLLLGLAEFLDQAHWLALETAVESAAGTGVNDIAEFLRREIKKPVVKWIVRIRSPRLGPRIYRFIGWVQHTGRDRFRGRKTF